MRSVPIFILAFLLCQAAPARGACTAEDYSGCGEQGAPKDPPKKEKKKKK